MVKENEGKFCLLFHSVTLCLIVILRTFSQLQAQSFTLHSVTLELGLCNLHFLDFFAGWLLARFYCLEALAGH